MESRSLHTPPMALERLALQGQKLSSREQTLAAHTASGALERQTLEGQKLSSREQTRISNA